MSLMGHSRHFDGRLHTSGLAQPADIRRIIGHVTNVPIADGCRRKHSYKLTNFNSPIRDTIALSSGDELALLYPSDRSIVGGTPANGRLITVVTIGCVRRAVLGQQCRRKKQRATLPSKDCRRCGQVSDRFRAERRRHR
jgi:hypothetical protein